MSTTQQQLTPAQAAIVAEMTRIREMVRRSTNAVLLANGIVGHMDYGFAPVVVRIVEAPWRETAYTECPCLQASLAETEPPVFEMDDHAWSGFQ